MPEVVKKELDQLTIEFDVNIAYQDYARDLKKQLNYHQANGSFKGFRKGKTPMSFIKKMFGKQALLQAINSHLEDAVSDFLKDVKYLGEPIPQDQDSIDFDVNKNKDYQFTFKLGLRPIFELQGFDEGSTYPIYDVEVDEEMLNEEVTRLRETNGELIHPEDNIEEKDVIKLKLTELEGEAPKEDGIVAETSIAVDLIKSDSLKATVLGLKLGDTFTGNIYDLEEANEKRIRKYLLSLEDNDDRAFNDTFSFEIIQVSRRATAALTPEFFGKVLGEEIETEEAFKSTLKERIKRYYEQEAEAAFYGDLRTALLEKNNFDLPEAFLQEWRKYTNPEGAEEELKDMAGFVESIRWQLIMDEIASLNNIEVTLEDIERYIKYRMSSYFGGTQLPDGFLDDMVKRMLNEEPNSEMVREASHTALIEKIIDKAKETVSFDKKPITASNFKKQLEEKRKEETAKTEEEKEQSETEEVSIEEGSDS